MMDRKRMFWSAALILPLLGFGYTWATTHAMAQKGTDWDVPVRGYDPRDLLRGHYITYQYDWPGLASNEGEENLGFGYLNQLCIEGVAPTIKRASTLGMPAAQRPGDPPPPTPKCTVTVRAQPNDSGSGLERGIFYVPQAKAADYEKKLADPKLQGVIRLRIRDDGVARPIALTFRARPEGTPAAQVAPGDTTPIIRATEAN